LFYRPLVRYPRSKEGTANESEAMKNITLQDLVKIGTGQQMRLLIRHSEEKEDDESESDDEKLSTDNAKQIFHQFVKSRYPGFPLLDATLCDNLWYVARHPNKPSCPLASLNLWYVATHPNDIMSLSWLTTSGTSQRT